MPQLHCYVTDALAERLQERGRHQHISVSKYIAGLVEKDVGNQWPEGFFETVFGGWEGDLVRPEQGEFEEREPFD